jgi:membrane protein DedA with SNARE-associated domain
MPFRRYLLFSTLASLLWCTGLALFGHALGQHWSSLSLYLRKYDVILLIGLFAVIALAGYKRLAMGGGLRDESGGGTSTPER